MKSMIDLLQSEHLKIRKNWGVWLLFIVPVVITLIIDINIAMSHSGITNFQGNPWMSKLGQPLLLMYVLLFPMMIALCVHSLFDLEYSRMNFKRLYVLPVSKRMIIWAKFIVVVEILGLSTLFAYWLLMLSGNFFASTLPKYHFGDFDMNPVFTAFFVRMFIICLSVAFLQYALSSLFCKFSVPVGIACVGTVIALIASPWKYIYIFPYNLIANYMKDFTSESVAILTPSVIVALLYLVVFGAATYLFLSRIKV
ncbi:MAG: ABC transporter permease [Dysgonamonadaceae bacterium]|jgi:hypothetical protein|nr:ABC transporter permease [Dysgonamonadaceae bacterium]